MMQWIRGTRGFFSARHIASIWLPAALLVILYNASPLYSEAYGPPSDPDAARYLLVLSALAMLITLHILYTPIFPAPRWPRGTVAAAALYAWIALPTITVAAALQPIVAGEVPPDPSSVYNGYYYGTTLSVLALIFTPALAYIADCLAGGRVPRAKTAAILAAYGVLVPPLQASLEAFIDVLLYRLTGDITAVTIYMREWSPDAKAYIEENGPAAAMVITWGYIASIIVLGFLTEQLYTHLTQTRSGKRAAQATHMRSKRRPRFHSENIEVDCDKQTRQGTQR